MRLQDKVVLITGSGRGMGRAMALRFAQEGAKVIINHAHHDDEGASVVNEVRSMGREATAIAADVSSEEQVKRMVEMAIHAFERIDIWINSAGANIFSGTASALTEEEKFQQVLAVDVKGTFLCCRAAAPVMKAQGNGCILNVSWDYALTEGMPGANAAIFAAAKGAIHSLSMCLARELAPAIRVNVIAPDTPGDREDSVRASQALLPAPRTGFPYIASATAKNVFDTTPMWRSGEPGDVAEAALYLASPEASFITGQTIIVNGGRVMY